jgi:CubicO group peptidase (beta-lactamase class C family)/D-alanyl-D-alanine dipeptidase
VGYNAGDCPAFHFEDAMPCALGFRLPRQEATAARNGVYSAIGAAEADELETGPFPISVELETMTMYRGSFPVSNSRVIGNGGVADSLGRFCARAAHSDPQRKRASDRASESMKKRCRDRAQKIPLTCLSSDAKRFPTSAYGSAIFSPAIRQLQRVKIRCLALLFVAFIAASGLGQETSLPGHDTIMAGYETVVERLRGAIEHEMDAKQLPAISIALVDGEHLIWAAGFGHQDAARKTPATADTIYRVGSVSKLFTDIAVMQLVERGELELDEPVTKYLPDSAPSNPHEKPMTLRQLISHRSGLVRESPVGNYFDPEEPTLAATVASLNETALVYPPDTKTKYSNAGIAVVGRILEQKLGVPFDKQIGTAVFKPLGMKQCGFMRTPEIDRQLATGWMWTYDGRRFEAPKFALGTAPAGNLYASVQDLAKFLSAIFAEGRGSDGSILKPETLRQMMSPPGEVGGDFGLGFHLQKLDGEKKIGHGGAVYGFSTQVEALPKRKLGVAAVAALDGANGVVTRITDYALRLLVAKQTGKPLPQYELTGPVSADRAQQIAGRYQSGEKTIELEAREGRLFYRPGDFRYELRALGGELVVDDVLGYGTKIRPLADGIEVAGERYESIADPAPDAPPQRWRGLIGEYGWDHNTLYVLEDRGRLWALIEWFYYYPLTELSENEFAFPASAGLYHGEKFKFTRDSKGEATQVVAAEVLFKRRKVGTKNGETFKIKPVKPIDELRAAALAASPPEEKGEFRAAELVEPSKLDPTIKLDIRYASDNNFTGATFYRQSRAFLQRPAAQAVVRVHQRLKERGLGLLIHDAYRPWHVTKMFWEATPVELRHFVANPANGSRHNRGCAVDLTLYDLASGEPIEMVAGYDEMSVRSYPAYPGGTSRQRWHRELLRHSMEAEGFTVYEFEWWHFDFADWKKYRIGNATFEELDRAAK